jgi:hypothetical protein
MDKLNYGMEFRKLHDSIADETLKENYAAIVELLAAHLYTIYGLISSYDSEIPDIFPVRSVERAQKLIIYLYAISSCQVGSSICDMLIKG